MKTAQLNTDDKPIKETVIIVDTWEALQIALAMKLYVKSKRKSKKLEQLLSDLENASMFY
jgi:hypothetical protein